VELRALTAIVGSGYTINFVRKFSAKRE